MTAHAGPADALGRPVRRCNYLSQDMHFGIYTAASTGLAVQLNSLPVKMV